MQDINLIVSSIEVIPSEALQEAVASELAIPDPLEKCEALAKLLAPTDEEE